MLDEYLIGDVRRISPEAPVPVVEISERAYVAGGAANVAANIASLGGEPVLLGLVGRDESARTLASVLAGLGVDCTRLTASDRRVTITKTRVVSGQQQIVRLDREDRAAVGKELSSALLDSFRREMETADGCVLSDYGKGLLTEPVCREMIGIAAALRRPTVVDPKGTAYAKYSGSTVVTPNLREAEIAAGFNDPAGDADLFEAARRLHELLDGSAILVTRGAEGMTLFRKAEPPVHVPALARQVFDVTGAGDTVVSSLTLALSAGASMEEAMTTANLAASVVVQKTGTATLTAGELLAAAAQLIRSGSSEPTPLRSYATVPNREQVRQ